MVSSLIQKQFRRPFQKRFGLTFEKPVQKHFQIALTNMYTKASLSPLESASDQHLGNVFQQAFQKAPQASSLLSVATRSQRP